MEVNVTRNSTEKLKSVPTFLFVTRWSFKFLPQLVFMFFLFTHLHLDFWTVFSLWAQKPNTPLTTDNLSNAERAAGTRRLSLKLLAVINYHALESTAGCSPFKQTLTVWKQHYTHQHYFNSRFHSWYYAALLRKSQSWKPYMTLHSCLSATGLNVLYWKLH